MNQFRFTVSASKIHQKEPSKNNPKGVINRRHKEIKVTIVGMIVHANGNSFAQFNKNDEIIILPLTDKCQSLIGKNCYWSEHGLGNYTKVLDSSFPIKEYPHLYKYKYRKDEIIEGYVTANNEFHVTSSFNKGFSSKRRSRRV